MVYLLTGCCGQKTRRQKRKTGDSGLTRNSIINSDQKTHHDDANMQAATEVRFDLVFYANAIILK